MFSKVSNKWYVHWDDDKVPLGEKGKAIKVMVRMMQEGGGDDVGEVDLVKGGDWGPKFVYSMKYLKDILRVEGELEAATSVWGEK